MDVTVVGPQGAHHLSLPGDVPLHSLLPDLIDLLGEKEDGAPGSTVWSLAPSSGNPLPPSSTLRANGILEGATLYLSPWSPTEPLPMPRTNGDVSPAQRTQAVLPRRMGLGARLVAATQALMTPTAPAAEESDPWQPATSSLEISEAAPPAPPKPTPAALTRATTPPPVRRARHTWRSTNYLERLDRAIIEPRLKRCATIAVVSPKGGVGKTTTTALLGTLLALLRRDRTVAVDTNPDYGSLGRVLAPEQTMFVDDVLEHLETPGLSITALDAQLGRASHGLMVLPAPTDPARMEKLDESAYRRVIERLQTLVGTVLLDCGTGLQEPAARAAISTSDQLVLVTDAEPAAASLVAEAATLLAQAAQPLTLVVNKMPSAGSSLDLGRLCEFVPSAKALCVIPSEPIAAAKLATAEFTWRDAPRSLQRALRELAVALISDWPRLGLTI